MLIAIHKDTDYEECVADGWAECLEARGVDVRWVDLTAQDALRQVQGCDGVMWRWGHKYQDKLMAYRILHSIELYIGIPVFPDHRTSWHYDEKVSQYYMLQAAGVPMPKTWVFWDEQEAMDWAKQTDYPKVFKLSAGAGGMNVSLVHSTDEACRLISRMFGLGIYGGQVEQDPIGGIPRNWRQLRELGRRGKHAVRYVVQGQSPEPPGSRWRPEKGYAYFQEFVPHSFETRIRVVGDRALGCRRFPPIDDFRASSAGIKQDFDPSEIDLRCVEMAFDISERLGFDSMAYDFLSRDGEPLVSEMSYTFFAECPGYWTRDLKWISEQLWSQEAHVEAFLNRIRFGNQHVESNIITSPEQLRPA